MKKYNSIENSYREAFIEKAAAKFDLNMPFVILEKIDGANFGIRVNDDIIKCQSRSQELGLSANFYNFSVVLEKHSILDKLEVLFEEHFKREFTIYGEIFGGFYNGTSKGQRVQNRVDYCPENVILFYDIFDHRDQRYLSYNQFQKICETWKLPYIRPMKICSLQEALNFEVETYRTSVPSMIKDLIKDGSLEDIEYTNKDDEEDFAEGIVIRPLNEDLMVSDCDRFILKKKSSKFNERKPRDKKSQALPENVPDLSSYINENRVKSAISKFPEDIEVKFIISEVVKDAIEDYIKDNGPMESSVLVAVKKSISKLVYPLYIKIKQ